jgi:hypothetical protein
MDTAVRGDGDRTRIERRSARVRIIIYLYAGEGV